jgi:hypothetical protein
LDAVSAVVDPEPVRLDELTGRNHRGMSDEGNEIALAAGFDSQNAEAVLGVMQRDAVDQPSQDLGRGARPRCLRHQGMMKIKVPGRYRDCQAALATGERPRRDGA